MRNLCLLVSISECFFLCCAISYGKSIFSVLITFLNLWCYGKINFFFVNFLHLMLTTITTNDHKLQNIYWLRNMFRRMHFFINLILITLVRSLWFPCLSHMLGTLLRVKIRWIWEINLTIKVVFIENNLISTV